MQEGKTNWVQIISFALNVTLMVEAILLIFKNRESETRRKNAIGKQLVRPAVHAIVYLKSLLTVAIALVLASCDLSPTPGRLPGGPTWMTFTMANTPLANVDVHAIAADDVDRVWIGTDSGAATFNEISKGWRMWRDELNCPLCTNPWVRSIASSKDLSIWFAVPYGVLRYNPNAPSDQILTTKSFSSVYAITADRTTLTPYGEIWCATSTGIAHYHQTKADDGSWDYYSPWTLSGGRVSDILVCAVTNPSDNSTWFGAYFGGMVREWYDFKFEFSTIPFDARHGSEVLSLGCDASGTVWVGQYGEVSSFNSGRSPNWIYNTPASTKGKLPACSVNAILTDSLQLRWFGTDSGLVKMNGTDWTRFQTSSSPLPDDRVSCLAYDHHGNLWIGTANGIAVHNDDGIRFP